MSETTEKETEIVTGIIEGVTQKKPDTWQVEVKPDGSQYTKNLWTKDSELVTSLTAKLGQAGAFVCNASHWTNQSGQDVRSLWINSEQDVTKQLHDGVGSVPASGATSRQTNSGSDGMTPEKWDAKERRDYRSRAWAQTLGAFQHTIRVDEKPEDVFARLQPFQRKVFSDVCGLFAFPEGEEDIPF